MNNTRLNSIYSYFCQHYELFLYFCLEIYLCRKLEFYLSFAFMLSKINSLKIILHSQFKSASDYVVENTVEVYQKNS